MLALESASNAKASPELLLAVLRLSVLAPELVKKNAGRVAVVAVLSSRVLPSESSKANPLPAVELAVLLRRVLLPEPVSKRNASAVEAALLRSRVLPSLEMK